MARRSADDRKDNSRRYNTVTGTTKNEQKRYYVASVTPSASKKVITSERVRSPKRIRHSSAILLKAMNQSELAEASEGLTNLEKGLAVTRSSESAKVDKILKKAARASSGYQQELLRRANRSLVRKNALHHAPTARAYMEYQRLLADDE